MVQIDIEAVVTTLAVFGGALYTVKNLYTLGGYIVDKADGLYKNMKEVKTDIKDIKEQINEINSKIKQ